MKIEALHLRTDRLQLELPAGEGRCHSVEIEHSGGVTGDLRQGAGGLALHGLRGDKFHVTHLEWWLSQARLALEQSSELAKVALELEGSPEMTFELAAEVAKLRGVRLELDGLLVTCDLALEDLRVVQTEGGLRIGARRLSCRRLHLVADAWAIAIDEVRAENVEISLDRSGGPPTIEVGSARAAALAATFGGREAVVPSLIAPLGGRLAEGALFIPGLGCPDARFRIPSSGAARAGAKGAGEEKAREARSQKSTLDASFLDSLAGHAFFNVDVEAKVPLIRTRRATHRFRLRVEQGALSFRAVEAALATLEDSLLDFRVRKAALELVKDVPLIPFDTRTLVSWPLLRPEDHRLAARGWVRLATLLKYELPLRPSKATAGEASAFAIRRADVEEIDVAIRLVEPTRIQLHGATLSFGADGRSGLGSLRVVGDVRHDGVERAAAGRAGHLRFDLEALDLGIEDLFVGSTLVESAFISLAAIESARVDLAGIEPRGGEGVLRALAISNLRVQLSPGGARNPASIAAE